MGSRDHITFRRQMDEKSRSFNCPDLARIAHSMKTNVPANPIDVGFLRSYTVTTIPDRQANLSK
jgi:hypothetical protein